MKEIATSHIKKALIITVIIAVYKLVTIYTNNFFIGTYTYAGWCLVIVSVLSSVLLFAKYTDDKQNFVLLFSHGLKTTAAVACLLVVFTSLIIYFILPNLTTDYIKQLQTSNAIKIEVKEGQNPIEMGAKVLRMTLITGSLMGSLILGTIGSLIGAIASQHLIKAK